MDAPPLREWLVAFCLTLLFEAPIVLGLGRRACPSFARRLGVFLLANVASHPAVWFVFPRLGLSWAGATTLAELWAFGVEAGAFALVFEPGRWREAVLISLAANACSFGAGVALWSLGWL
jgi:hypothetical protein